MPKTKSTKAVKLPPYPVLRAALVARVEMEAGVPIDLAAVADRLGLASTDAVRKAATRALELYAGKCCWFCRGEHAKPLKIGKAVDWTKVPLCPCLSDARLGVIWHPLQDESGRFYAEQGVEALNRIRKGVARRPNEAGYIPADTPVVSRCCDAPKDGKPCGSRFTMTAGMYKSAVDSTLGQAAARDAVKKIVRTELERLSDYKHSTKCRDCRDAWRDRAATLRPRKELTFAEMVLNTGLMKAVR